MQRFRGGLVFKAHRPLYHSTLGLRVMKKKKRISRKSTRQEKVNSPCSLHLRLLVDCKLSKGWCVAIFTLFTRDPNKRVLSLHPPPGSTTRPACPRAARPAACSPPSPLKTLASASGRRIPSWIGFRGTHPSRIGSRLDTKPFGDFL